ncbi:MAG: hypothetical protein HC866_21755 [Leptolyngbyaceae cyanobacterium RU_5_1]|nr:hypothetical protein [Leptolyngbyaceae cyanobacterium RU_5_1]
MSVFRQYVAPLLIVLVFLVALVAVSSRIFLSEDMAAPAPIEEAISQSAQTFASERVSGLPPSLSVLITGLTDDSTLLEKL